MPTYNRGELLPEIIETVIDQSYKDWELVIVDDGSTDSSKQILDYYAQNKNIKVIYTENKGISHARRTAFEASKGEYIAVLDSDTPMSKTRLEDSLKFIRESKSDIVYGGIYMILNDTVVKQFMPFDINDVIKKPKDILDRKNPDANQIVPNFTVLAKRKCFKGAYRDDFVVNDDLWTIYYWVKKGYKFGLLNKYLSYHICDAKSVSTEQTPLVRKFTEQLRQEENV